MQKWAYFTEQIYESELDEKLDKYGDRGWEIAGLVLLPPPPEVNQGPHLFLAVFKQPTLI